jgi:hypothetical protein
MTPTSKPPPAVSDSNDCDDDGDRRNRYDDDPQGPGRATVERTPPAGVVPDGLPTPTMYLGIRQIKGDGNRSSQAQSSVAQRARVAADG